MKTLLKVFIAFFYLNSVTPAFMYYIYDESPKVGYAAAVSTGPYKNRFNSHKKYFIGSNNQKYMKLVNERAVDSHFAVLKTPKSVAFVENQNYIDHAQDIQNKANSKQKTIIREDVYSKYGERETSAATKDNLDISYQDKDETTPSDNQAYIANNVHNYNQREYLRNGENIYEKKPNFVAVNEHKAPVSKEQKVVKSNNHQFARKPPNYHQSMSVGGVKDKILHKASTTNERTQIKPRNNDVTQKQPIVSLEKMDSKKRETLNTQLNAPENYMPKKTIYDNVSNYINREINNYNQYKNNAVPSRIGNHEELVDMNETPYALFYRINPDHLDEQDILIESPLAELSNGGIGDKVTWDIKNQADPDKTKSKRAPNVKIHKKVKNHTYRSR